MLGAAEPTDVSVEYTGQVLTIEDIEAEQKTWYDPEKVDLEYSSSEMLDANTYQVTAKIKDELAADWCLEESLAKGRV